MNNQPTQQSWPEIKAKISAKWSKFSDTQLEGFKNNLGKVTHQIQQTYGIPKEQAEKEYTEFSKSIIAKKSE